MDKVRGRFRSGSAGIGFVAATVLIFGQAGAAHAPAMSGAPGANIVSSAASVATSSTASSGSKYSALPFKRLKIRAPATAPRLAPAVDNSSYATLAMGPIRFRDGALTLPGHVKPVTPETKEPDVVEVGHSVSVPTGIALPEPFNVYPRADGDKATAHKAFAGLPLVSAAHAAPGAHMDGMGGPLNQMPLENHILFGKGDAALDGKAQALLDKLVETLRASHGHVELMAYAGKRGSRSSEARRLSLQRGLAVRSYLVTRGIAQSRISVRPMGGAPDEGPEARVDVFYASY